jgi:hypothetical protein
MRGPLRRSRALIILACQLVLVESGMHDLGSCATPVVPEPMNGGKGRVNLPSPLA